MYTLTKKLLAIQVGPVNASWFQVQSPHCRLHRFSGTPGLAVEKDFADSGLIAKFIRICEPFRIFVR